MTEAGEKLLSAAREAVRMARGEIPAYRIYQNGFYYVPEGTEGRWQPIETVPRGINVDVWLEGVDGGGWRWASVMVEGDIPYVIIDSDNNRFHPDENGMGVTHWMLPPSSPFERSEKDPASAA